MSISSKILWVAGAAGVLLGASLASHRRSERDKRAIRAKPEPVQTWEDEGGAVPLRGSSKTAQHVTPHPEAA